MVRVRQEFSLSLEYRELIMLRVAWLNKAEFEWDVHYPVYLDAGGTADKAEALRLSSTPHIFNDIETFGVMIVGSFSSGALLSLYGWNAVLWGALVPVGLAFLGIVKELQAKKQDKLSF